MEEERADEVVLIFHDVTDDLCNCTDLVWRNVFRDVRVRRALSLAINRDEINKAVFYDTNPIPMKYMMKKLGILTDNEHRLPMMPATHPRLSPLFP